VRTARQKDARAYDDQEERDGRRDDDDCALGDSFGLGGSGQLLAGLRQAGGYVGVILAVEALPVVRDGLTPAARGAVTVAQRGVDRRLRRILTREGCQTLARFLPVSPGEDEARFLYLSP
jgi:hypothetical protein